MSFFVHNCIFSCNSSNHVKLNLNNVSKKWLIDTGASLSAVKYETIISHRIPIIKHNICIKGIGGQLNTEGFVYLNLVANGMEFSHKFYVLRHLPCLHDGIIGQDFLRQFNCIINYELNNISLSSLNSDSKTTLPLGLGTFHDSSYLILPPRCEKIFYVDTILKEECIIKSKELCEGVYLAGGICKPCNGKIPIQLLNSREDQVCLSYFSPEFECLDDYDMCTYDKSEYIDSERVRQLFSLLDFGHLNVEERRSVQNICAKFCDIFYLPGDKLSVSNIYEPEIKLKPNVSPSYVKPYRLPRSQREEITNQVNKLLSENIIEPACSEWSSPVLLVPKKSDDNSKKWRLVIDYRKLNERIIDDKFPLPNISDILDSLSGSMYFTHLDLNQSYYQLNLKSDSKKLTAFTTHTGQYQLTRLPMGLKTSPSCFSRAMTLAMTGLNYEKCLIYLDDLLCFGRSLSIHNKNLIDIFSRLRKVNLKLNPSKCKFLRKDVLYLGHVVSAEGIKPDPEKTKAINSYPTPQNSDEVRRFVAFSNYYRKFIPSFAEITLPLNKLCRKHVQFDWSDECQKAFEKVKSILSSPKVMQYPNFDKENTFILQTDASGFAIGAVLNNGDRRPVAFASRTLNKAEKNYPTIEKELLAITWAVKYFRPYLYGKRFIIETDHKPLIYLFNMTNPSSRTMKFRLTLEEYDFDVVYVRGKDNVAADALSRVRVSSEELKGMHENLICVMTRAQSKRMAQGQSDSSPESDNFNDNWTDHPRVIEMLKLPKNYTELTFLKDEEWTDLKNDISSESEHFAFIKTKSLICVKPMTQSQCTRDVFVRELSLFCNKLNIDKLYIILDDEMENIIKKLTNLINKSPRWTGPRLHIIRGVKRITDRDTRRVILNDYHILPTSGHAGIRRMLSNIKRRYFWPGIVKDVTDFVSKCDQCQRQKHFKYTKQPMVITNLGNSAFDRVFLDLVGPLSNDSLSDSKYILTLQCDLSKYVEAYPIASKDSVSVATALVNNFILRYGIPREIITDKGTEFVSSIMQNVCKLLNISHITSTSYHHQTIGALENSHKNLISYLRIMTNNNSQNWSSWLPYWCFAFNTTIHTETQYSPYELVFGKRCNIPSNLTNTLDPVYNFHDYPVELKYRLQKSQLDARDNIDSSKQIRKVRYDSYVNIVNYKPGDFVLIKNEACKTKLDPLYLGPFEVLKDVEPNIVIKYKNQEKLIHKNRTKLYKHSQ